MKKVFGKILDFKNKSFFNGSILIEKNKIVSIQAVDFECENYILPGLIDAHVHVESSMLIPSRFAQLVIPYGTVAVVTDPHEIANVLGVEGVDFMIRDGETVPLKFFFGAPSCVPATDFDSSGSVINSGEISKLLQRDDIWFLSEMMNYPGVIFDDPEVHRKLGFARLAGKKIDGHAPGLSGDKLSKYVQSGIETDHECFTLSEALEKIELGMKIQIREGSAANNFDALYTLLNTHVESVMLCTDDCHPDDLVHHGHMNKIIKLGLKKGISIFNLIEACVYNPIKHYNLPVGRLQVNDSADFIVVDSIEQFNILETYIDGNLVYSNSQVKFDLLKVKPINYFKASKLNENRMVVKVPMNSSTIKVIEVIEGQLLTNQYNWQLKSSNSNRSIVFSSVEEDILKIVVYNRYKKSIPCIGFVKGFGLTKGAFASSIAHDSHNIIAVGVMDNDIIKAINNIIISEGGISTVDGNDETILALPFGGIMSDEAGDMIALNYECAVDKVKSFGSKLKAPFMTLSFMSLLVIPSLKISDKGLFDVNQFNFVDLFE